MMRDEGSLNRANCPMWINCLAGHLASLTSITICYPLDCIKTRYQVLVLLNALFYINIASPYEIHIFQTTINTDIKRKERYISLLQTVKRIAKDEGLKGFYKGYQITGFTYPLNFVVYFGIYERMKIYLTQELKHPADSNSLKVFALSSSTAGFFCAFLLNPLWVIRTRMITEIFRTEKHKYSKLGITRSVLQTIKEEGVFRLYNGLNASIVGLTHPVIQFCIYEKLKLWLMKNFQKEKTKPLESLYVIIAATISKCLATVLTYPHELVRANQYDIRKSDKRSPKMLKVIQDIWHKHKLWGFYRGVNLAVIRVIPNNAILFVLYEYLRNTIYSINKNMQGI